MEMASAPVLKPCPFCGGKPRAALRFNVTEKIDVRVSATIGCEECRYDMAESKMAYAGIGTDFEEISRMEADVIWMWNRRDGHDDSGD